MWWVSAGLASSVMAANAVPNAPTVPPGPMVDQPLAPPANDVPEERPSAQHVWVPGHWGWSGHRYVWIAGHYAVPPRGHRGWVEPRWERRGGVHIFIEGHWR